MGYKRQSPMPIVEGGTGKQSFTAYSVIAGGTTSTGSLQNVVGVGTSGQVLTSAGAGALPAWVSPAASSISITGDTGGALVGAAFTFTGGTTGLTFAGSGATETLGGTLVIANGGTNATSMSTSTGIVKYDGTRLVTSTTALIDSSNRQTNTSQPAFYGYLNTPTSNATGDGTGYTVALNAELYDQNSNFNTGTATFTAPVTGIYHFDIGVLFQSLVALSSVTLQLVVAGTSARTYNYGNSAGAFAGNGAYTASWNVPMTATDTATFVVNVAGGTKTVTVYGAAASDSGRTFMSGFLIC